ncbi:putative peptide modification system cyclase, partial [Lysobacter maris]
PPAIAFNERDWVVVGDLRNLTGNTRLDDSLEQAFRISLEQSRFVNVLSDLKVRDSLTRMRMDSTALVDRGLAAQIAQRDGARAVIVPTVSEVGGRLRFSVEVIDPHTQTTVYAHAADGKGEESILASIDTVTGALRADLGEAVAQIDKDSRPLPEVTTGNLDALRAYALGQEAYARYDFDEALQMYEQATELDPDFALAWLGQVRVRFSNVDAPSAMKALRQAAVLKDRLPPREALYLDAWVSEFDAPWETAGRWVQLAKMYPDYLPGRGNAALWLYEENRFAEALPHALAGAVDQNPLKGMDFDTVGRIRLAMEAYPQAEAAFTRSLEESGGSSQRRLVSTAAAQRHFEKAESEARRLDLANEDHYIEKTSLAIDQGKWKQALELSQASVRVLKNTSGLAGRYLKVPVALSHWLAGDADAARATLHAAAEASLALNKEGFNADAEDDATTALGAALILQRMGDADGARRIVESLARNEKLMRLPVVAELASVVKAEALRRAGEPEQAVALLRPLVSGRERYQTRVALMEAYADAGQIPQALEQARWLQQRRGLAYGELTCGGCLQALNVLDSNLAMRREAELLRGQGKDDEAERKLQDFNRLWPVEALPDHLREI